MKLNKVLALALSGVMAVSMLAGCSNNTNGGKDEQTPATGIVAAVNNGQSADNKVKVTFTADATLDAQLSKAVAACAEKADASEVQTVLKGIIGKDTVALTSTPLTLGGEFQPDNTNTVKTGDKIVGVRVFQVSANYTEAAAMKEIAEQVNSITSKLVENSARNNYQIGWKYVAYDYAGTVSMMQTTALDGTTNYYAAIVITNTCTLKTVTA